MISLFLVEDERIARESIRDNVPWQEHDILFLGDAPDGEVALPQLLEKRPDILLTDIKMPFMDGWSWPGSCGRSCRIPASSSSADTMNLNMPERHHPGRK